LHDGKYLEAALLAFENNYSQLFINTINQVFSLFSEDDEIGEISFDDGKLMIAEDQENGSSGQRFNEKDLR
jgi:hypothetical protein